MQTTFQIGKADSSIRCWEIKYHTDYYKKYERLMDDLFKKELGQIGDPKTFKLTSFSSPGSTKRAGQNPTEQKSGH